MSKDDLSMAYRVVEGAGRRKRSTVLRLMLRAIGEPGLLAAEGIDVTWQWRNTPSQDMREAPLDTAVAESRAGFIGLLRGRLERDLSRVLDVEARAERRRAALAAEREAEAARERERRRKRKRKVTRPRARKGKRK